MPSRLFLPGEDRIGSNKHILSLDRPLGEAGSPSLQLNVNLHTLVLVLRPSEASSALLAPRVSMPVRSFALGAVTLIVAVPNLSPPADFARATTRLIREDKVRAMARQPAQMAQFLHTYGVESVVLEDSALYEGCDAIRAPSSRLALRTQIAIISMDPRRHGRLAYRFADPLAGTGRVLKAPSDVLSRAIEAEIR